MFENNGQAISHTIMTKWNTPQDVKLNLARILAAEEFKSGKYEYAFNNSPEHRMQRITAEILDSMKLYKGQMRFTQVNFSGPYSIKVGIFRACC